MRYNAYESNFKLACSYIHAAKLLLGNFKRGINNNKLHETRQTLSTNQKSNSKANLEWTAIYGIPQPKRHCFHVRGEH